MSPRKQGLLGELNRAPGARPSRIALRRSFTRQPEGRPAGARAAGGKE